MSRIEIYQAKWIGYANLNLFDLLSSMQFELLTLLKDSIKTFTGPIRTIKFSLYLN
jgi:hypothetical protein